MAFDGKPLTAIYNSTSIARKELYGFIQKALTYKSDGEIWGFVALKPRIRIKDYTRLTVTDRGLAGRRKQFFRNYPELESEIKNRYLNLSTTDEKLIYERGGPISYVHWHFTQKAKKLGVKETDYPLRNEDLAYEFVRLQCREYDQGVTARKVIHARQGQEAAKRHDATSPSTRKLPWKTNLVPYDIVEFDEHLLNFFMTVQCQTPEGITKPKVLTRCWLLVLLDVVSRAILGYRLSLSPRYTSDDVLQCFAHALTPWKPIVSSLPFAQYEPGAGFPSGVIDNCRWRLFDEVKMDNCATHVSSRTIERISHVSESRLNFGESGEPAKRPYVESFFNSLGKLLSNRMISTTGTNIFDYRRRGPENEAEKYDVDINEIYVLADVMLANYNASRTHSGLFGQSPLETIEAFDNQKAIIPRYLLPAFQRRNPLNYIYVTRTIRGRNRGLQPYIQYKYANYRSEALSSAEFKSSKHTELLLEIDRTDLRTIRCYEDQTGTSMDVYAQGEWGDFKHDLDTRDNANRMRLASKRQINPNHQVLASYRQHLKSKASSNKQAAKQFARQERDMSDHLSRDRQVTSSTLERMRDKQRPVILFDRAFEDK